LDGGVCFIEGFKADTDFGWQRAIQYGSNTVIKYRSKWTTWQVWVNK
jgi:hypothetical protein